MTDANYQALRELMDTLPGGYPATESGIEIRLLKKMFTEEEARVALHMKAVPEPAAAIANRMGEPASEIASTLAQMSKKASITTLVQDDTHLYMIWHFLIGLWEAQMIYADAEFVTMAKQYMPHLAKIYASIETQQTRVIPVGSSVQSNSGVKQYDEIQQLLATKDKFVVAPCVCSKQGELDGERCEHTMDRCIAFGPAAEHYLHHNFGREVTREEIKDLLELGESEGLVLNVSNSKDSSFICMCCGCHCVLLSMLKLGGMNPGEQVRSTYYAAIDQDACASCELCVDQCQMQAISFDDDDDYSVDRKQCIGCGICLSTCNYDAVQFIEKNDPKPVFDDAGAMYMQMMVERGVLQ